MIRINVKSYDNEVILIVNPTAHSSIFLFLIGFILKDKTFEELSLGDGVISAQANLHLMRRAAKD